MSHWPAARALVLLTTANLLPWVFGRLCRGRWGAPLDFGLQLPGGRRLLGDHKTWRGLAAALVGVALLGRALGLPWWTGIGFGALSMLGDCLSSAWKRYRGYAPGRDTLLIDQLPEALLPLIGLRAALGLGWMQVMAVAAVFGLLDMLSLRVRHPSRAAVRAHE